MLPMNASRLPVLSSMIPAFSWNIAVPATGRRSGRTAPPPSPRELRAPPSRRGAPAPPRSLLVEVVEGRPQHAPPRPSSASAAPFSIASTSGSSRVQPTISRMRPSLRTSAFDAARRERQRRGREVAGGAVVANGAVRAPGRRTASRGCRRRACTWFSTAGRRVGQLECRLSTADRAFNLWLTELHVTAEEAA